MALPSPIPPALVELIADRFRLLSEPMRIRALDHLRGAPDGAASVGEIADALDSSQQNISKHLADLSAAGVLVRQKEGNRVIYAINETSGVLELCELVCGGVERQLAELDELVNGIDDRKELTR